MSWGFSFTTVEGEEPGVTATKAYEKAVSEGGGIGADQIDNGSDAMKAAIYAAIYLIDSGSVGSDVQYTVSLNGHANPDHKPAEGWATDMISISVVQMKPETSNA